ncbi:MAG: hypothetical protein GY934_22785 [Gammaproteobacteria bacterium]|nr:hypothetical protein [Gammaproteobacteria bacterium]
MEINVIFNVPADTDISLMDDAIQLAIAGVNPIYPPALMGGTRPVGGRKLIYAVTRVPGITETALQGLIDSFGLDWQIVGMKSVKAYPVMLDDEPVLDDEGEQVKVVNTFVELDPLAIGPFLNPLVDEEETETPRTGHVQLSQFPIKGYAKDAWSIDV